LTILFYTKKNFEGVSDFVSNNVYGRRLIFNNVDG